MTGDDLRLATGRRQAGRGSSLDVEQAGAGRAQTAAAIPNIENSFASATYRIAVLTGRAPGALTGELTTAGPIPKGPQDVAVGIPADTLRQRPDVRAAERGLAGATARIGVAEAQLLPDLRLTGNIGTSAFSIGGLFMALAGILRFAELNNQGDPEGGIGLELQIIAAVVIGGGSLSGGRGSILGSIVGALAMKTLDIGCVYVGVDDPIQRIVIGAIIIAAVALDQFTQRRQRT